MTAKRTAPRLVPLLALTMALTGARALAQGQPVRPQGSPAAASVSRTAPHAGNHRLARSDFNGDGYADLAVGVFGESVNGQAGAGAVNVIYGSATGLQDTGTGGPDDQFWTEDQIPASDGAEKGDGFGSSVEAGDFNGDGFADMAVGIRAEDVGTVGEAGAVAVVYGSSSGLQASAGPGAQFWTQNSPGVKDTSDSGDHMGSSLAHGDFNGDGYDDLAIGDDFEGFSGLDKAGAVTVLYGSATGLEADGVGGPDDQFWTQNSRGVKDQSEAGDRFGRELTSADFNGDGYNDLAINADFEGVGTVSHAGSVNVLYGSATGLQATGVGGPEDQFWSENTRGMGDGGAQSDDRFGASIASGDFNADGYGDLAAGIRLKDVGSNVDAGAMSIIYGSATGLQDNGHGGPNDQFWTQDMLQGEGSEGGDWFGYSTSVADFNGDGYADLCAGARFEDVGSIVDAGSVNILYGSGTGLVADGNQYWTQNSPGVAGDGAETGDELAVWSAGGDFNADGAGDLAVAAWLEDVGSIVDAGAVNALYGTVGTGLTATGSQFWNQDTPGMAGDGAEAGDEFGWTDAAT